MAAALPAGSGSVCVGHMYCRKLSSSTGAVDSFQLKTAGAYRLLPSAKNGSRAPWRFSCALTCETSSFAKGPSQERRGAAVVKATATEVSSAESIWEPLQQLTEKEPSPVKTSVTAFAPATVANLGPGFDFLGCAVEGLGDHVTAEISADVAGGEVAIGRIEGDGGRLSRVAEENCVGIAGKAVMELLGVTGVGVVLHLQKGLPLGSGLGSSAASAAAAAVAVNALFGSPLSKAQLVQAGLKSEASVSGYHADNVGPALLGGFALIRSYQPLDIIPLAYPSASPLFFVVVSPAFEAPTKEMRAALPKEISMKAHVANSSQAAALVSAILLGDAPLLGSALASDTIVEPRRGPLIPGLAAVKIAARAAGAFGCTISGAGPTAVAVTDSRERGSRIGAAMVEAFLEQGKLQSTASVQALDREGARVVEGL